MKVFIKAIAYHLPERIISNAELAQEFPEWTEEKIAKKLGILQRHVVSKVETASDLAVAAANELFAHNPASKQEIDYIIFCTQSADYILPSTACCIQSRLGLRNDIGAIDLNLGCSGWIYGLSMAKGLILGGMASNVLLLTSETYSKYLHPKDKGNRTIFGDGAAATLVSTDGVAEIGQFSFGTDGTGAENLIVRTGGARQRESLNDLAFDDFGNPKSSDFLYMNGTEILNYTLDRIPSLIEDVLKKNGTTMEEIDMHVYHQANKYIANLQRVKMRIPTEKYYCCFENMGNTVSSTIPIALYEAMQDASIKQGMKVLSVAQGLGYSWGGVMLKF